MPVVTRLTTSYKSVVAATGDASDTTKLLIAKHGAAVDEAADFITTEVAGLLAAEKARARAEALLTLRAAATRISELIVQKHLKITRFQMREYHLYTVKRCTDELELRQKGLKSSVPNKILDTIHHKKEAMEREWGKIEKNTDIMAGMAYVRTNGNVVAHAEPADNPVAWASLGSIAASVCKDDKVLLRQIKKMLWRYVALRSTAPTETTRPDASLVKL